MTNAQKNSQKAKNQMQEKELLLGRPKVKRKIKK